ncbi:Homeobox protein CDX-1, partial [Goodea atripinnis]
LFSSCELLSLHPLKWVEPFMFLFVADGKTRTKDKYRVVYTDHQRLELEKEFHYSKYITIRRKAELATALNVLKLKVKKEGLKMSFLQLQAVSADSSFL